jgi:predicted DNA-binding transcriptional regulator AlpA
MPKRNLTKAKANLATLPKRPQGATMSVPPPTTEPELVYAARLHRRLGVSNVTLWRWRHDERLGFPKGRLINRRVYFPWHEVAAWLDRQEQVA